ncbi:MAG: hypothetical protein PVH88_14575 [Ignavibacteria bacterium]|jgi:plasmid stability protein
MSTITIKNIPKNLYEKLKLNAAVNRRSINNEVIYCIENMVKSNKIDPDEFINEIDSFHKALDAPLLTEKKLKEYKEAGRL